MASFFPQTVAFKSKHALPNDTHTREILIRRHSSIRRSLRPGSFRTSVSKMILPLFFFFSLFYTFLQPSPLLIFPFFFTLFFRRFPSLKSTSPFLLGKVWTLNFPSGDETTQVNLPNCPFKHTFMAPVYQQSQLSAVLAIGRERVNAQVWTCSTHKVL